MAAQPYIIGCPDTLVSKARLGCLDEVKLYLEGRNVDVNSANRYGSTALHGASDTGRVEIVRYLISRGANVNITYPRDPETPSFIPIGETGSVTPLVHAVSRGHVEIAKILIQNGAKTDVDIGGQNLLDKAISSDNLEMVGLVISLGFDINRRNNRGETPLATAMSRKACRIVGFLLENGADYKQTSTSDHPISEALRCEEPIECAELLLKHVREKEGEKGLVDYLNSTDNPGGCTALHTASIRRYYEMVELLLECGADPNIRDRRGKTPCDDLRPMIFTGDKEILALLESRKRRFPQGGSPSKRMRE